jgi:hypothetical protein
MAKPSTALARRPPCNGLSPSCDCTMCRERRRKRLEAAVIAEERYRDGLLFDAVAGLAPGERPSVRLSPSEATVCLKRRKGEKSLSDLWRALESYAAAEKQALADVRTVARRCGFSFSARMDARAGRRKLRALVRCPHLLGLVGELVLTPTTLGEIRAAMLQAFEHALQVEKRDTSAVARECGFVLTESRCRKGLVGSWSAVTVEGAVPVHATTAEELRYAMREAADAPVAMHVERRALLAELPEADAEDVVEEPTERTQQRERVRGLLGELLTRAAAPARPAPVQRARSRRQALAVVEVSA